MGSKDRDVLEKAAAILDCNRNGLYSSGPSGKDFYHILLGRPKEIVKWALKMYPYMSERRQGQIAHVLEIAQGRREGVVY